MDKKKVFPVRRTILIGIFAGITAVFAQLSIPLPFTPVPITLGLIGVFASGIFLERYSAFLSQVIYLILGGIGLPIFHSFSGGFAILTGPTGGYLLTYPMMAFVIGWSVEVSMKSTKSKRAKNLSIGSACLLSVGICYLGGTLWLAHVLNISFVAGLYMGVIPFILGDLFKILVCVFTLVPIRYKLEKEGLI